MKKIIILMVLLSYGAMALDFNIGLNVNNGDIKFSNDSKTYDFEDRTLGIQFELTQSFVYGELGIGASYEDKYKLESIPGSFIAIPVYGLAKVYVFPIAIKPYLVAKGGIISLHGENNIDDLTEGKYYAAGLGVKLLGTLNLEGLYSYREMEVGGSKARSGIYSLNLSFNVF